MTGYVNWKRIKDSTNLNRSEASRTPDALKPPDGLVAKALEALSPYIDPVHARTLN